MSQHRVRHNRYSYRLRMLGTTIASLLLAIVLVRSWPRFPGSGSDLPFSDRAPETIALEEIQPASQSQRLTPPPPAPLPPVVVPNDVLIETELEFSDSALPIDTPGDDARRQDGTSDQTTAARLPDQGARLLRNVQPAYPPSAKEDGVRARIVVEVKIDAQGRVEEALVLRRVLLNGDGTFHAVAHLGYGLEEAALTAARRSLFRPARANGQPVPTRTTLTFAFGRER